MGFLCYCGDDFSMKINRLNINPIKYNSYNNKDNTVKNVSYANISTHCAAQTPSCSFMGSFCHSLTKEMRLPNWANNTKNEWYKIKIFNKIEQKPVDALLRYNLDAKPINDAELIIYNKDELIIGDVGLDFKNWIGNYLSFPYLRLHDLGNGGRSTYSRIGDKLIQAAVEISSKSEAKGRVFVCARNDLDNKNDPFVFYHKKGFSVADSIRKENLSAYFERALKLINSGQTQQSKRLTTAGLIKKIEELEGVDFGTLNQDKKLFGLYKAIAEFKQCKLDEIRLDFGEYMYLCDDKVKEIWIPRIKENPILTAKNRIK